jgi:hypothetical protein
MSWEGAGGQPPAQGRAKKNFQLTKVTYFFPLPPSPLGKGEGGRDRIILEQITHDEICFWSREILKCVAERKPEASDFPLQRSISASRNSP